MNKKKIILLCSVSFMTLASVAAVGAVTFASHKDFEQTRVGANDQELVLDDTHAPTISAGVGELALGDYSTYTYTNASAEEGYHVVLGNGGVMRKTEATNALTAVGVTYSGKVKVEVDFEDDFSGDHYVVYPESGVSFTVSGNYWKITALEDNTKITSVQLNYACDAPVETPDKSTSYVDEFPTTGEFAHLETIDDDIYFVFNGRMNGYLDAKDLTIRENRISGNFQYIIDCEKIEYRSPSSFDAYFNISDYYYNRDLNIDFYCHLYVRNNNWSYSTNDLRVWQDGEDHRETVVVPSTLTMDGGNKTIELKANAWEESTGYFYQARIKMSTTTKAFRFSGENKSGGRYFDDTHVEYTNPYMTISYVSANRNTVPAADMFTLGGDDNANRIVASEVTYEEYESDRYMVSVKFDVTLFTKYYNGNDELNVWCHLLVNGDAWDGNNGDLKAANTVASTDGNWGFQLNFWSNRNYGDTWVCYNYWNSWSMVIVQLKKN